MSIDTAFYVHWPYCEAKCPYCDFNSHLTRNLHEHEEFYAKAILAEIEYYAHTYGKRYLTSIYFGGGTPSLMSENTLLRILEQIAKFYILADDIEITIEVNPASYMYDKFKCYRKIGINRVSIGVQSFNAEALKDLGRVHNVAEAEQALYCAGDLFDNYSFDLIYARYGQSIEEWEEELYYGLSFDAPHMSLYELTIEPGTKFETLVKNGKMKVISSEEGAKFYDLTQKIMNKALKPAYEVSNHAAEGFSSKHNNSYWKYKEYIGVGPGAHSRIWLLGTPIIMAQYNEKQPNLWQKRIIEFGSAIKQKYMLDSQAQAEELILNSMRIKEGLNVSRFELLWGRSLCNKAINDLISKKLLEPMRKTGYNAKYLRPTQKGLLFVDYIIRTLTKL